MALLSSLTLVVTMALFAPSSGTALLFSGGWCLCCFVLITAYSSVLISFLTTIGGYKPLVNSVNDLPKQRNIRTVVNKDLFADILFEAQSIPTLASTILLNLNYFNFGVIHTERCKRRRRCYNPQISR